MKNKWLFFAVILFFIVTLPFLMVFVLKSRVGNLPIRQYIHSSDMELVFFKNGHEVAREKLIFTAEEKTFLDQWVKEGDSWTVDFNSYAPKILIKEKRMTINLQNNRIIINYLMIEDGKELWIQCSRKSNSLDQRFKDMLESRSRNVANMNPR